VSHWLEAAALVSHEGKHLKIALPESETGSRENLLRATTRKYLEEVAQSLLQRTVLLDVALDSNLKVPVSEPPTAPAPAPVAETAAPVKPAADEMDDELIRATVEKFKATLLAS
jgi:hypothetical protein